LAIAIFLLSALLYAWWQSDELSIIDTNDDLYSLHRNLGNELIWTATMRVVGPTRNP
jgi:hypothetical protein